VGHWIRDDGPQWRGARHIAAGLRVIKLTDRFQTGAVGRGVQLGPQVPPTSPVVGLHRDQQYYVCCENSLYVVCGKTTKLMLSRVASRFE